MVSFHWVWCGWKCASVMAIQVAMLALDPVGLFFLSDLLCTEVVGILVPSPPRYPLFLKSALFIYFFYLFLNLQLGVVEKETVPFFGTWTPSLPRAKSDLLPLFFSSWFVTGLLNEPRYAHLIQHLFFIFGVPAGLSTVWLISFQFIFSSMPAKFLSVNVQPDFLNLIF